MATMHLLVRMYVASYTAKITNAANEVLVNAIRTCSDVAILYSLVPRPFSPPVFDWLQNARDCLGDMVVCGDVTYNYGSKVDAPMKAFLLGLPKG